MSISHHGFAVAIDGPVGVGKSTTARLTAQKLNFTYIDTGAMYRAAALNGIRAGIDLTDDAALEASLDTCIIELHYVDRAQRVFLNGDDVTDKIRDLEVSEGSSVCGSNAYVREKMVAAQQKMAQDGRVVMDGRDIASVVIPWAQVKIYLDADVHIRAQRRLDDLNHKGLYPTFEEVLEGTKIRDARDMTREASPLIIVPDALVIDTGIKNIDEVSDEIVALVKERGGLCFINSSEK